MLLSELLTGEIKKSIGSSNYCPSLGKNQNRLPAVTFFFFPPTSQKNNWEPPFDINSCPELKNGFQIIANLEKMKLTFC